MNAEICVIGSLNLDVVIRLNEFPAAGQTVLGSSLERFCGGKGANQAYAMGKLGARVVMVGQVGADDAGRAQIANLASVGVGTESVLRDGARPSGTAIIAVDKRGENRIIVVPGANGSFTPDRFQACQAVVRASRFVLLQMEIPFETVCAAVALARSAGVKVMLDPAPAPDSPLPDDLLAGVDYLTPNSSELGRLTGSAIEDQSPIETVVEAARVLCARGARRVLAKLGNRGVVVVSPDGAEHVPGFEVQAVDTTAAGDCFNGAFAFALARGHSEAQAARFANAAAACSVRKAGAQPSMPALAEVEALLQLPSRS